LKRVVLDASVVLKWYLYDEKDSQKATGLLHQYISGELDILAPSLLEYEVVNGLFIAQKRGRIKEEKILTAIEGFIDLEIELKNLSHFYSKVIYYCGMYRRSVYDASYLATADVEGITMITSDEGLYHSIKKDLKWVKWLGGIQ
jgi:predicted nucleic acid-binding protein